MNRKITTPIILLTCLLCSACKDSFAYDVISLENGAKCYFEIKNASFHMPNNISLLFETKLLNNIDDLSHPTSKRKTKIKYDLKNDVGRVNIYSFENDIDTLYQYEKDKCIITYWDGESTIEEKDYKKLPFIDFYESTYSYFIDAIYDDIIKNDKYTMTEYYLKNGANSIGFDKFIQQFLINEAEDAFAMRSVYNFNLVSNIGENSLKEHFDINNIVYFKNKLLDKIEINSIYTRNENNKDYIVNQFYFNLVFNY